MQISFLHLKSYRNYFDNYFKFSQNLNIISGYNGRGKTNLIEAIQFYSIAKSIKTNITREVIRFDASNAVIEANIVDDTQRNNRIVIKFSKTKKIIELNNKLVPKSTDLLKIFSTVFVNPDDINISAGKPSDKRRYLDIVLSKTDPEYMANFKDLMKIVHQKSKLFKQDSINGKLMELYDEQLRSHNEIIVKKRNNYLKFLEGKIKQYIEKYTEFKPKDYAQIFYQSSLDKTSAKDRRRIEYRYRECMFGAHRDDFSIIFKKKDLKKFCSLGEKRLISILIKVSEKDYFVEQKNIRPVLLVDDALMGLDENNKRVVGELLNNDLQKIVTTTNKKDLSWIRKEELNLIEL